MILDLVGNYRNAYLHHKWLAKAINKGGLKMMNKEQAQFVAWNLGLNVVELSDGYGVE